MPLNYTSFIKELISQAREPQKNAIDGHPDQYMRKFYRALYTSLHTSPEFRNVIKQSISQRASLTASHFVSLLPRAAQYILRKKNIKNYIQFNETSWQTDIFPWLLTDPEYQTLLKTKNNAMTRPRLRYKGLAALATAINTENIFVIDLGCSLNLGLPAILEGKLLEQSSQNPFTDLTPHQTIKKLLYKDHVNFRVALGVDTQDYTQKDSIDWVKACERFSSYDSTKDQLEIDLELLHKFQQNCLTHTVDISTSQFIQTINSISNQQDKPLKKIIHASMIFYQLEHEQQKKFFKNAHKIMSEGDLLLELCYKNSKTVFDPFNVCSKLYIKQSNSLSDPYEWLLWRDAYCHEVKAGKDFQLVNNMLNLR